MEPTTKRCTKCGVEKPVDQFPIRLRSGRKPRSHCRPCHNAAAKLQRSKDLQTVWRLRTWYGLTIEDVDRMATAQGNSCPICERSFETVPRHIDHDHQTKRVRGLLCGSCNKALGLFQDSPDNLHRASRYLIRAGEPAA